jgi:hypothetical protein
VTRRRLNAEGSGEAVNAPTAAIRAPRYCRRCRKDARTVISTYPEHRGGAQCGIRVDICARHGVPLRERAGE